SVTCPNARARRLRISTSWGWSRKGEATTTAPCERYRRSVVIEEKLGNRAGMASTVSKIGVWMTETGQPAEGVAHNLRALAMRLDMGLPQAGIDLHWLLRRQRTLLREDRFRALIRERHDQESANRLTQMLDEQSTP